MIAREDSYLFHNFPLFEGNRRSHCRTPNVEFVGDLVPLFWIRSATLEGSEEALDAVNFLHGIFAFALRFILGRFPCHR